MYLYIFIHIYFYFISNKNVFIRHGTRPRREFFRLTLILIGIPDRRLTNDRGYFLARELEQYYEIVISPFATADIDRG